jgi:hydrogenase/urease accessory protein HupE
MKKSITFLSMLLVTAGAIAHPGHGHGNPLSPGHYVTNPEHAIPLTLAIATGVILITWLANRLEKRFNKK